MMKRKQLLLTAIVSLLLLVNTAVAQGTAFTYQGKLTDSGNLANGNYDLQFKLFDALAAGTQLGTAQTLSNVTVSNGIFTVTLDFGVCASCFNGSARFLEIAVRPTGGGSFTTLTPRQPITSTPYAIKTTNLTFNGAFNDGTTIFTASNTFAGDSAGLNTTPAPTFNDPTGKFNAYFGAGAGQQNTTGFSNAFFGAQTGFSNTISNNNAFFGAQTGFSNTTGSSNAFFGAQAGQANTTSSNNAFFGRSAGSRNTTGNNNAFFGALAGSDNNTGTNNTFIGATADFDNLNTTGSNNTLLGAGTTVTSGVSNGTAIGYQAFVTQNNSLVLGNNVNVGIGTSAPAFRLDVVGDINTSTHYNLGGSRVLSAAGSNNLFAGINAGTTGSNNAFFGWSAGFHNTTGSNNAFFGTIAGFDNTTGSNNAFFGLNAGGSNTTGIDNAFFGSDAGQFSTGSQNAFFGRSAGVLNSTGTNNTFIGRGADFDANNTTGNNNTLLGAASTVTSGSSNATAIGFQARVEQSNALVLGAINGVNNATADTKVGIGTTTPTALLDVQRDGTAFPETARFTTFGTDNKVLGRASGGSRSAPTATPFGRILLQLGATGHDGSDFATTPRATIQLTAAEAWTPSAQGTLIRFNTTAIGTTNTNTKMIILDDGSVGIGTASPADLLHVNGIIRVQTLGAAGSTSLCRNASNQIATCSSSLRYKTAIQPFLGGLEIIKRLRPITFTWKQSGMRDLGFAAEEVAKVEPLFTFTNDKGEVEGVKYDRLSVVLVNAVKELKAENDSLKEQNVAIKQENQTIRQQQQALQVQVQALKQVVCKSSPKAEICKP